MDKKKPSTIESQSETPTQDLDKTLVEFLENKGSILDASILQITSQGHPIGKERYQPRYKNGGVVFLHCANKRVIRANGRDLSLSGVGINIPRKLKSHRIGEHFVLEFSPPHRLQSLLLRVELARLTNVEGHNHLGFKIISESGLKQKILGDFVSYLASLDPWF